MRSKQTWIILRLVRQLAKAKAVTSNDYRKAANYVMEVLDWDEFDKMISQLEAEEAQESLK